MSLAPPVVAAAFLDACRAELAALKPGNVHRRSAGHGMTVVQFEASAAAVAPVMAEPGLAVGARILRAVEATRRVVADNTNLGIVLLAAPLAQAALAADGAPLRERLAQVLSALEVTDAELAFRAIRLAAPGGLGESPRHDVRAPARVTLREAMAEAAGRDLVARQYASAFAEVWDPGVAVLRSALGRWGDPEWAVAAAYLGFLARFPDSHVARKFGSGPAEQLRREAAQLERRLRRAAEPAELEPELVAFDRALKAAGRNPGTSADLTVASVFAAALEDGERGCRHSWGG